MAINSRNWEMGVLAAWGLDQAALRKVIFNPEKGFPRY
jgi:hypothetical protein